MERDCESELSKLNIEQNACIYHFGASVIHGQRSNILRLLCTHVYLSFHLHYYRSCNERKEGHKIDITILSDEKRALPFQWIKPYKLTFIILRIVS